MHANDQGLCLRVTGSILVWVCNKGFFGQDALRIQLIRLHYRYLRWCRETHQSSHCVLFTPDNLHVNTQFVFTTSKAADARHLAAFTYELMTGCLLPADSEREMVLATAWGLWRYYEEQYRHGRWLTDQNVAVLRDSVTTALLNFSALSAIYIQAGDPRMFHCKPKDHQLLHLVELWCKATKINPRCTSNYKNENFIRLIKGCARFVATELLLAVLLTISCLSLVSGGLRYGMQQRL